MPASKHHPNGGATLHCDNSQIERAIAQYQATHDIESLSQVIELAQPRAQTLIKFRKTYRYRPMDELLSDVNFKLLKAVDKFDPSKGAAFTFVSQVISNVLCTSVANARRERDRYRELSKPVLDRLTTNGEVQSGQIVADLTDRIRREVKTTIEDEKEQDVQRWLVKSFCDASFEQCRCECADAARTVYGVSHARSRELYDLSMLAVRRVLYDDLPAKKQIIPGQLLGTRSSWAARYKPLLDGPEFSKFVALTWNLSPFVVVLIDPQSRSRRGDRNPGICRQNLLWILAGHPAAIRLFNEPEAKTL